MDLVENMAYASEGGVPWHGKGFEVNNNMSTDEMMKVCGADYEVFLQPSTFTVRGEVYRTGDSTLYRMKAGKPQILSNVSDDWFPNQNKVAFDFFKDYVTEGDMSMETAGVLDDGRYVWVLAKMKEGTFEAVKGKDVVDPYFLFVNPHVYGRSITNMFTPVRVVCWNTMTLAINTADSDKIIRWNHRREFLADEVKKKLLQAKKKMEEYKEFAGILTSKRAADAAVREYFRTLLPMVTQDQKKKESELSKGATTCLELMNTQPGAELGEGSWWQAFNAFTYFADHKAGKESTSVDTRLSNAWFGQMQAKKRSALYTALDMAKVSELI